MSSTMALRKKKRRLAVPWPWWTLPEPSLRPSATRRSAAGAPGAAQRRLGGRGGGRRLSLPDAGVIPAQRGVAEGVVLVHQLAGADVAGDVAERALPARRQHDPVLRPHGAQIPEQGMPGAPL